MSWRTFVRPHWRALLVTDVFTSVEGTLRGLVIHSKAVLTVLTTRRMVVHLAMPPGHRLCASGDAGVHQEVHGVTTTQPESLDVDVPCWGKPAARPAALRLVRPPDRTPSSQCSAGRFVRPFEKKSLSRILCIWGARSGKQSRNWRRATSAICNRSGRDDRVSAHTASASLGAPALAFQAMPSSDDPSAA
jgi:hypothetical protein